MKMTITESSKFNCQCVKPDNWMPGSKPYHTCQKSARHRESNTGHNAARDKRARQWNPTRSHNPAMSTRYHNVPTTFIGIDGEGVTLPDGTHLYVLIGVADQQITNPDGLTWDEIFEFLWEQFLEHGTTSVAYVGFFLGYDFTQWFKKLPEERARMLLTAEGRAKRKPKDKRRIQPFPVKYGEWEFDILGTKRFKLRKAGAKRWMNICDTGPFFQKSFLKVIDPKEWSDPIVSPEEYAQIAAGKEKRSTAILDRDMLHYNARENEILSRVMMRLNEGFQSLGIHLKPSQWFGPGQGAQAWLESRAITTERLAEVTPQLVLEHARESYFGGWFEIMAHGIIPGITYEYDINSAYPYIISKLPCLEHGKWEHNASEPTEYTLVKAKVKGTNPYMGSMLHRDRKGNIYRPHNTQGWYWLHEIQAAQAAKLISTVEISESWSYHPCDCLPPFREVRDIYELRKQVGKKTPLGIACKLVPNSLYGKFAQSIGEPEYGNPIYASLITAGCRTMILNAIATHPVGAEACVMVATDGVYFTEKHPNLPISGELGDWDCDEKSNLCLFKPGVYWDDKARAIVKHAQECDDLFCGEPHNPVFKSRGVNAKDFGAMLDKVDHKFRTYKLDGKPEDNGNIYTVWPAVSFPVTFAVTTATIALHRNDWGQAGTVIQDATCQQSSNPKSKRRDPYRDGDIWRTSPRKNSPYEKSHPYEKRFGMEDPFSDENMENAGINQDGYAGNLVREARSND
jgi:hypothetical protein